MKKLLTAGLCASSVFLSGCLGHNALFNNVQDWNASATGSKWVNQGISFAFWIVPVYGLTLLGYIVVFNSIEFWTGSNPLGGESAKVSMTEREVTDGLGNTAVLSPIDENTVAVTEMVNGEATHYTLKKEDGRIVKVTDNETVVIAALSEL